MTLDIQPELLWSGLYKKNMNVLEMSSQSPDLTNRKSE